MIFEVSRDVCEGRGKWTAKLDLLPTLSEKELTAMLNIRKNTNLATDELFTGILHNRLGRVITKEAGVGLCPISYLREKELCKQLVGGKIGIFPDIEHCGKFFFRKSR